MSGKKNMKSKQNMSESTVVAPVEVKASVETTAPVEVKAPEVKQKGGRTKKVVEPKVEVKAPVVEEKVADSGAEKKQRGGRKKAVTEAKVEAPVETPVVPVEAKTAKPRAPRASKAKASDESKPVEAVKPKVSRKKKSDTVTAEATTEAPLESDNEKHIRSFKVKLPGSEAFEGRFTGLTPYQAANKALSKYFREGERTDMDVTFSICESTRKSKKSVYTYVGKRHQLEVPVKYTIQDGREIVKNFKNTLKKVKKSDTPSQSTDTNVSMSASA